MPLPIASPERETPHSGASLRLVDGKPARVRVITYGCSHNQSDSEHIAGVLREQGYEVVGEDARADVVVINSCTVKGPSQESFFHAVRTLRATTPLVVAGCVPQADPLHPGLAGVCVLGVQQLHRAGDAVAAALDGAVVRFLGKAELPPLSLAKTRRNPHVEIIPINLGCLHACAYCKTKHARGHLRSYTIEDIAARVRSAVADGVLEIWLTSEDVGAYGRDIGTDIARLLRAILPLLPDPVMLRIGMANPPYIAEHLDDFAAALNHPRVFAFAHIPVQSGSDAVLVHMRRGYTALEFSSVVERLRAKAPGVSVATDVICGYPTETEEDAAMTIALLDRFAFPVLNISQFYARPGTPAATLSPLPSQEVKRRSSLVTALFKAQRPYDHFVGEVFDVWVSGTSDDGAWCMGHTKAYVPVLLPRDDALLGSRVRARVVRAGKHALHGELVR